MYNPQKIRFIFFFLLLIQLISQKTKAQDIYPGKTWMKYKTSQEAGWSSSKLQSVQKFADSIGAAAVMIIYRGAVVDDWGDVKRKYMAHSIRKSFLSALYGIHVDEGHMDVNKTLESLKIDDRVHPLTKIEKQATVLDLLKSRSGIFLPAAYEGYFPKPPRGSQAPGAYWLYNNWDFNALHTIFEKQVGKDLFVDFKQRIAQPIQMEDYDTLDGYLHYETNLSEHPAYPFRMSARDMARFGLLYLRKGKWGNNQIISKKWVEESTQTHSKGEGGEGYGYLWWTEESIFKNKGLYYAAGSGGHKIFVLPKDELVIVLRVDTYNNKYVSRELSFKLVSQILEAKTSLPKEYPTLIPFQVSHANESNSIQPSINTSVVLDKYVGRYQFEDEWMDIIKRNNGLILYIQFMGKFPVKPITDHLFFVEDAQKYLYFLLDKNDKPVELIYHHDSKKGSIQSKN